MLQNRFDSNVRSFCDTGTWAKFLDIDLNRLTMKVFIITLN
jgi:hypothetical protein